MPPRSVALRAAARSDHHDGLPAGGGAGGPGPAPRRAIPHRLGRGADQLLGVPPMKAAEGADNRVWRSLDELAGTPEFQEYLHREFPSNASEWLDPVGRRGFLKLMSASMALAGVTACTVQPAELIVPYVRQPE